MQARTGSVAVARYYHKLLAYKDEYEVARLFRTARSSGAVAKPVRGRLQLEFHLAPPDRAAGPETGLLLKKEFGPWLMSVFKVLARLKFLRGTPLDIFGYPRSAEPNAG